MYASKTLLYKVPPDHEGQHGVEKQYPYPIVVVPDFLLMERRPLSKRFDVADALPLYKMYF